MKLIKLFFVTFLAMANAQDKSFLRSRVAFDINMFRNATMNETKNSAISPLSIDLAMNCILFGASQQTFLELMSGLSYPKNFSLNLIQGNLQLLLKGLKKVYGLEIATKLYLNETVYPQQSYQSTLKRILNAQLEMIRFKDNIAAAKTINTWVFNTTHGMIDKVIEPSSLDENVKLILINCIYFKGTWLYTFPKNQSFEGQFFTDETNTINVPYMNIKQKFQYGVFEQLDEAAAISIPYKNSSMSMLLLLPKTKTGLPSLVSKLHTFDWTTVDDFMGSMTVNVTMPKFNASFDGHLNEIFKKMGILSIFDAKTANLDRMVRSAFNTMNIYIDSIIHKAIIKVDEEGTVAAAVTMMSFRSMEYKFTADRPFIFMLRSGASIVFMGQYLGESIKPITVTNVQNWERD